MNKKAKERNADKQANSRYRNTHGLVSLGPFDVTEKSVEKIVSGYLKCKERKLLNGNFTDTKPLSTAPLPPKPEIIFSIRQFWLFDYLTMTMRFDEVAVCAELKNWPGDDFSTTKADMEKIVTRLRSQQSAQPIKQTHQINGRKHDVLP